MKTKLALLLALAPVVTHAGGFCFTNVLFYSTNKARIHFVGPPTCGTPIDNSQRPVQLDAACCFRPTGSVCERLEATHLYVQTYPNTKTTLIGFMTWVNASTGRTNVYYLYLQAGVSVAEFELQADVAPCASSMLSWKACECVARIQDIKPSEDDSE